MLSSEKKLLDSETCIQGALWYIMICGHMDTLQYTLQWNTSVYIMMEHFSIHYDGTLQYTFLGT